MILYNTLNFPHTNNRLHDGKMKIIVVIIMPSYAITSSTTIWIRLDQVYRKIMPFKATMDGVVRFIHIGVIRLSIHSSIVRQRRRKLDITNITIYRIMFNLWNYCSNHPSHDSNFSSSYTAQQPVLINIQYVFWFYCDFCTQRAIILIGKVCYSTNGRRLIFFY